MTIHGTNFMDTKVITCKWGADPYAFAPGVYDRGDGSIRCDAPRVLKLEPPYEPGKYALSVALNGLQYSTPTAAIKQFYFYNRPHVQSLKPEFGPYTGDTFVTLSALAGMWVRTSFGI